MEQRVSAQSRFFADLLKLPEVHGDETLLEGILALSTANTMPEPVQAIIDFKKDELVRLKNISARILGSETNYLSLDQIKALASRWKSTPEEAVRTVEANKDKFPIREGNYYVGPDNAHLLAKSLEANTFIKAAYTIEIRKRELVELEGLRQSLESRLNEEKKTESKAPVKLDTHEDKKPNVKSPSATENTSPVFTTSSNIYFNPEANAIWGTPVALHSLGGNTYKNPSSLNTGLYLKKFPSEKMEGEDKRRFYRVDESNYRQAGFSTWPPTDLTTLPRKGSSSKGDLESRAKSTSPFPLAPVALPAENQNTKATTPEASVTIPTTAVKPDTKKEESWLTLKEILALTAGNSTRTAVYTRLYRNQSSFNSRVRKGTVRELEYNITEANYQVVGLDSSPRVSQESDLEKKADTPQAAAPEASVKTTVTISTASTASAAQKQIHTGRDTYSERLSDNRPRFKIGGGTYSFNPAVSYEVFNVKDILRQVHPEIFTPQVIDAALKHMGATDSSVTGQALIDFLKQAEGIITFSTGTIKNLEGKVGGDFKFTQKLLEDSRYGEYLHELPGGIAPGRSFINRHQLDDLANAIRANEGVVVNSPTTQPVGRIDLSGDGDTRKARAQYDEMLFTKGVFPPNPSIYSNLVTFGVLNNSSPELVRTSYDTFAKEMAGFEYFNYAAVRQQLGLDWKAFDLGYLGPLRREGLIKDIVSACGGKRGVSFYVVQAGKKQHAFDKIRGFHEQQKIGKGKK